MYKFSVTQTKQKKKKKRRNTHRKERRYPKDKVFSTPHFFFFFPEGRCYVCHQFQDIMGVSACFLFFLMCFLSASHNIYPHLFINEYWDREYHVRNNAAFRPCSQYFSCFCCCLVYNVADAIPMRNADQSAGPQLLVLRHEWSVLEEGGLELEHDDRRVAMGRCDMFWNGHLLNRRLVLWLVRNAPRLTRFSISSRAVPLLVI